MVKICVIFIMVRILVINTKKEMSVIKTININRIQSILKKKIN